MTEAQKDPNEKLVEDIEYIQDLLKEKKQKAKQTSEDSRSWLPEKFHNRGDGKSKSKFTGKRYKTPWETGRENTRNEYEKKKSPNYNKFRNNQDKEFEKPSNNSGKTNENHKHYKAREPWKYNRFEDNDSVGNKNYKQFNKPWERKTNKPTKWKREKFNKSKNYQESRNAYNDDKAEVNVDEKPLQKSWETTKAQYTKTKSNKLSENINGSATVVEDVNESSPHNSMKTTKVKYTNTKYNTSRGNTDENAAPLEDVNETPSQKFQATKTDRFKENINENATPLDDVDKQTSQTSSETRNKKRVSWKWDNQDKSTGSRKHGGYYDSKLDVDEDHNKFKKPWKTSRSRSTSSNWKWNKRHDSVESSRGEENEKVKYVGDDKFQKHRDRNKTSPTNWKWGKRGQPPSENRNKRYKEARSRSISSNWNWNKHPDSVESSRGGAKEKFKYEDDNKFKKPWESNKTSPTNWKWERRDQSPSETRNQRYKESRGWKSDKYGERKNQFKIRDSEGRKDFEKDKYQGQTRKFPKKTYDPNYAKDVDKENNDPKRSMSMVKRREWGAPKTKWGLGPSIEFPLKDVFCLPTYRRRCFNLNQCTKELMYLQARHTCTPTCPDIKYSFFIGTNGVVYECRGWRTRPGLPKQFEKINKSSLFIALAGQYDEYNIPRAMIDARDYVIRYGVKHDLIHKDYVLHSSVDRATISESEVDYDQGSGDQETGDQETEDQETEDQETGDQETGDQETEDQETGDRENGDWKKAGSNWDDESADDLSSASGSSFKTWESYSSSWDLKEEDLKDAVFSDGEI